MSILGRLALLFVVAPVVELYLLVRLGGVIGLWPTLGLVVATGAAGAVLAKAEGMRVLLRFQGELMQGRLPGQPLLDGLCVLVGGTLLLTPGILSDLAGLALLFPPTRRWIQRRMVRRLEVRAASGAVRFVSFGTGGVGPVGFGAGGFGGAGAGSSGSGGSPHDRVRAGLDPRHEIRVEGPEG
jgi:UPF0716 protein FxsA